VSVLIPDRPRGWSPRRTATWQARAELTAALQAALADAAALVSVDCARCWAQGWIMEPDGSRSMCEACSGTGRT
jgi:hypothetical protein